MSRRSILALTGRITAINANARLDEYSEFEDERVSVREGAHDVRPFASLHAGEDLAVAVDDEGHRQEQDNGDQ